MFVGALVGEAEGVVVGFLVGALVGDKDGLAVGASVGLVVAVHSVAAPDCTKPSKQAHS
jgi:hypothetical protein